MPGLSRETAPLWDQDTHSFVNDFADFATGQGGWSSLADASAAAAVVAATRNGILALTSGAVDNAEAIVFRTNATLLPVTDKGCYARGLLQYAEGATNAANVAF